MPDHQAREAAESLLYSLSSNQGSQDRSLSRSVNVIAEELAAGRRVSGRMSSVRRFFCLLVTFDLLFTSLLWLICIVLPGGNLEDLFESEILHYNMKTSMVDIVGVAACRFFLLLIFYALLHISNWSVVALTSSFTCGFLIAKIFCYDWVSTKEPVYHVFLILTSFTLAWGEAWFLDFRVFPQEEQAQYIFNVLHRERAEPTERTALLGRARTCGDSTAEFFSPVDTPNASPKYGRLPHDLILTWERVEEYKRTAENGVATSWRLLHAEGWRLEKRGATRGDVVESISTKEHGKVFRFTGTINCPAKWLFEDLRDNYVTMSEWNPTIIKARTIKKLAEGIDIVYQITTGGGKGIVTQRDFVLLRRLCALSPSGQILDEAQPGAHSYLLCGVSAEVPEYPPVKEYVRGNTKIGSWVLTPCEPKTSSGMLGQRCTFNWLFSCDLKGKMPAFVTDAAFSTVMLSNVEYIRKHVAEAKAKKLFQE